MQKNKTLSEKFGSFDLADTEQSRSATTEFANDSLFIDYRVKPDNDKFGHNSIMTSWIIVRLRSLTERNNDKSFLVTIFLVLNSFCGILGF